ncbi:PREDICTED: testis-expressed sequence 33 protein [Charadrius vociferus]|nr:PREDICTED: testis-expressed sequence 33 protein [Charadrius vociferus]
MDQGVVEVPASLTPDVAGRNYVLANGTSVGPEKQKKEHLPEACPTSQRISQRSSSSAFWKISKGPVAQRKAEDTKSISNVKEPVAGQHQMPRSRGPGSSRKTIKASCEKSKETCGRLSAKESSASLGPDMKAEWKLLLEDKESLIHANNKYKFASAAELTSGEEERRALCEAALIMGQKRLSDRTKMLNPLNSTSFADYNQLGFNLRSNIFQGGPLESRSLMKDSYTPDIIQKVVRDPKNWHGRRTDELGKWHQKNALNLNLQKALEDKYGKKKGKP